MFFVRCGYIDGFISWCKQIVGLYLTAFLKIAILIAGLMVMKDTTLTFFHIRMPIFLRLSAQVKTSHPFRLMNILL